MRITPTIVGAALLLAASAAFTAAEPASAPVVSHPSNMAISPRLSDMPTAHWVQTPQELKLVPPPKMLPPRGAGPGAAGAGERVEQKQPGPHAGIQSRANFPGIGANGFIPPDPNIAVGKSHVVQMVNSELAVFDKSGGLLSGPVSLSTFWAGLGPPCSQSNSGDPVVQYDVAADRWLISQLASTSGPYAECIGVSQTGDPSGAYNLYSYSFGNDLNDYPKFGVWPTKTNSAYLATYNLFTNGADNGFKGADLCAYDRAAMLNGSPAAQICALVPAPDGNYLPADLDGATVPPDGTPGYFLNFYSDSSLRLYQLQSLNFSNGSGTGTLSSPTDIGVAAFTPACGGGTCIPQPNNVQLDSLGDRLMYRLAYRIFPATSGGIDHVSMVVNHSITAGSSVGVRWYELQQPGSGGAFTLYQQGTFAPDSAYRWMGSAAMNGAGDIALGYSLSSSTTYPAVAFTGRTPDLALGTMGAETIMQPGSGAQTSFSRWGDYTALRVDPSDDTTFWYTNEYYTRNSRFFNYQWATAIGSFTIGAAGGGGGGGGSDFSLSESATTLAVHRGSSGSDTVTATGSGTVTLSASGLPKGTSATFSPNPVTATAGGAASTLTIKANRNSSTGTRTVTITGTDGSVSHSVTLTLTIQ